MRPATMVSAIIIVTAMAAVSSQMGGSAKADIYNIRGEKIGTATLSQVPDGVRIGLEVSKLSPGMHGIHIHAVGKCDPPDFSTAGPHLNRVKTATLIVWGEFDPAIPVTQSIELFRGLRHFGVTSKLVVYPREGHVPREVNHERDLYQRIIEWFQSYLGS